MSFVAKCKATKGITDGTKNSSQSRMDDTDMAGQRPGLAGGQFVVALVDDAGRSAHVNHQKGAMTE